MWAVGKCHTWSVRTNSWEMGQGQPLAGTHIPKISWASPWGKGLALMQEAPLHIPACQCTLMEHKNIWRQELSLDLSDEVLGLTKTFCS